MRKLIILAFLLLVFCQGLCVAKTLTLKDAILLSLRTNPNIRNAYIQRVIDKFNLRIAEHVFEPKYTLSGSMTRNKSVIFDGDTSSTPSLPINPVTPAQSTLLGPRLGNFFGEGTDRTSTQSITHSYSITPAVSINSPIGTSASLTSTNDFGDDGYFPSLDFSVTQHLMRGFGSAIAEAPLRKAYNDEYLAKLTLKNTIISQVNSVISAYYQLVSAENNQITTVRAYKAAKKTVWQNEQQIKAGRMAPNNNIEAKAQVASQRLAITQGKQTIYDDKQALLKAIGFLNPLANIDVVKHIQLGRMHIPSLKQSLAIAFEHNIAYQQDAIAIKNAAIALMQAKDNARWRLDLTASYSLTSVENGFVGVLRRDASRDSSVRLALTVPLEDLGSELSILSSKLSLRKAVIALEEERRDLILQVRNNLNTLKNDKEEIKEAVVSEKLAARSLVLEEKKLNFGLSTVVNITNLRTKLIAAQLAVTTAKISYIQALNAYYTTLGTTLKRWKIKVHY